MKDFLQEQICGNPYYDEYEDCEFDCELGECAPVSCQDCVFNTRLAKVSL